MSLTLDSEESLGTGIDRQVGRLTDLENTVNQLKRDLPSLKRQCDRFKTERAALLTEVTSLRSERDTLRLEVSHEYDFDSHLKDEILSTEVDAQGRANRRIWALEQQIEGLMQELDAQRKRHEKEIEKERNVSGGLRDRIGTLEEKRRRAQEAVVDAQKTEQRVKSDFEAFKASVVMARENHATPIETNTPRAIPPSPRSALQKRPSNILGEPVTPSKSQQTPSRPPSTIKKRSSALSPASLAKRCATLEDRNGLLKAEYDKLRARYQEDIKHWKEWKAVDTARREEKKKRKQDRQSRKRTTATATASPEEQDQDQESAAILVPETVAVVALVPPSQESVSSQTPAASQEPRGSQRVTRSQAKRQRDEEEKLASSQADPDDNADGMGRDEDVDIPAPPIPMPPPSQKRRPTRQPEALDVAPIVAELSTPSASTAITGKRATPAARVTPWLGSGVKPRSTSTTAAPPIDPFDMDDTPVASPLKRTPSIHAEGSRHGLIRDRGEGHASSLRRAALIRTFSTDLAEQDAGLPTRGVSPNPGTDSVKRRRLDMEGLSPAEKAQERKRLNNMTPAEKRALYAEYKGKGRYLPPEEVQKGVTDEYEIDPKQNDGVSYQYHDVRRGRAERKNMHGGDCECCTGYYEAVGALPRYNTGPAWKDPSQTAAEDRDGDVSMTEAQVREHQNKVSRHRETWVKPPTPPGYWQIGFPNTQDVEEQNKKADAMVAEKEARIRREAAHRGSKWKKKS